MPELLTARQAAHLLKVTERSVWRWRDEGRLPCVKLAGKFVRFRVADLAKMITPGVTLDANELPSFVHRTI